MSTNRFLAAIIIVAAGMFSTPAYSYAHESAVVDQQKKKVTIKGVVKDDSGETLPGVAVRVSNAETNTLTDLDGKFTISYSPEKNVYLTFYYLGMKDEKVFLIQNGKQLISDDSALFVKMKTDTEVLSEVVVTGYGNVNKNTFTGTVTSVTNKDIMKAAPQNAIAALQIFDPSLKIAENMLDGSNPNSLPSMTVRGQSSIPT